MANERSFWGFGKRRIEQAQGQTPVEEVPAQPKEEIIAEPEILAEASVESLPEVDLLGVEAILQESAETGVLNITPEQAEAVATDIEAQVENNPRAKEILQTLKRLAPVAGAIAVSAFLGGCGGGAPASNPDVVDRSMTALKDYITNPGTISGAAGTILLMWGLVRASGFSIARTINMFRDPADRVPEGPPASKSDKRMGRNLAMVGSAIMLLTGLVNAFIEHPVTRAYAAREGTETITEATDRLKQLEATRATEAKPYGPGITVPPGVSEEQHRAYESGRAEERSDVEQDGWKIRRGEELRAEGSEAYAAAEGAVQSEEARTARVVSESERELNDAEIARVKSNIQLSIAHGRLAAVNNAMDSLVRIWERNLQAKARQEALETTREFQDTLAEIDLIVKDNPQARTHLDALRQRVHDKIVALEGGE